MVSKSKEEKAIIAISKFHSEMKNILGEDLLRRSLMGYYGELLVSNEFKKRGFEVVNKGNLTGYDLLVNSKKIEVRTSAIKKEWAFPESIRAWGWKLQKRDKNKNPVPTKYDYIVLVKLDDDWSKYELFVLSKKDVEKVGITYFSGYQTVAKVIYLFKNGISFAKKNDKHKMITSMCVKFNNNPKSYLINWEKLSKEIKN